jgi:hypothetical protein
MVGAVLLAAGIDLKFSETVGLALSDTLNDLGPVLERDSVAVWIAGVHSQTRSSLDHFGSGDEGRSVPVYDQIDEAVAAFAASGNHDD